MYKEIKKLYKYNVQRDIKKPSPSHQEILQFYQCFYGSKDTFIVNYIYLL